MTPSSPHWSFEEVPGPPLMCYGAGHVDEGTDEGVPFRGLTIT